MLPKSSTPVLSLLFSRLSGQKRDGRAFTLIEILIVLGIVVLLAVMLFPSLQGAYRHGHLVKCMGNMTAYSHAFGAFIADKGTVPPAQLGFVTTDSNGNTKTNNGSTWYYYLEPYLGDTTAPNYKAGTVTLNSMKGNGIGVCPGGTNKPNNSRWWDYGMNNGFPNNANNGHFYPATRVTAPSKRFLLGEDVQYQYVLPYAKDATPSSSRFDVLRHDGQLPLLFFDGHVELRTLTNIPYAHAAPGGVDFWGQKLDSTTITW